ncbi:MULTISPECIES: hypothetical protein [unclassified Bradyrhizobium]|uniref:hypothetical protein n=1 Tax=unclassified Bradyrhizobium TaxID=2631580 RepID=UPI001FFA1786|nr:MULTISPECIES: hypothetical protein [unclassified Bradyrhizobium]MCK1611040.1 hypothetical protein [Bradyrhizobium sp. 163]MCK1762794.1 hypothetical protein [Bradyrhizobium sp. 136]
MRTPKKVVAVTGDENAAIAADRRRVADILESPEGKRNPSMAQKLALYSVLDAETARSILAEAPAANPYLQAMDREGPLGLGAATVDISGDPVAARRKEIEASAAAFNAERGFTKKSKTWE